ncbi:Vacuolar transporter chaperone complex subunit [Komagataella phaffii CBS 7435]|uniref:Vacuolar membrane protein involved in vacuolar polyphosphate accumulation n=2 Tax=Komagataella phaffii TaxID=460519 RepID=C4R1E0_KOMPG|nr:Vacuolar membrane protein involved in vacuolar polyphosphate accumulation [Komagataella phaffii GS115]AOA62664.1 GQ67_00732T0 [Komagataella phaffii]CAH2448157.1 Vacuolar transporter chaperone complex subunit [Komagataella phaffii CBS 7435]AOA67262.1 GQ68_00657T0 [Komagataella phaffii GS115]CAY69314.1 Vacuolar membrane protein involved in vacuolar polyphosphate accumulation [Komagataella phaffii GS115]CCA38299.1 Vacuolar transporter chaperone complex subunit [Komagataella phaffii CBS 7435]
MLFGVKLKNEIYPPWKDNYIKYDHLKRLLKENIIRGSHYSDSNETKDDEVWNEKDEEKFAEELDANLSKVFKFQAEKYEELDSKIGELEHITERYLDDKSKFDLSEFRKDLEHVVSLANELDHFARLNFTGFLKIVKKHDRLHKKYSVKALLNVRLKNLPYHTEDYSPFLYRLSFLYQFLRDSFRIDYASESLSRSLSQNAPQSFISTNSHTASDSGSDNFKVLKFWVHPENLMEIKTTILRHLPALIFTDESGDDDDLSDPVISTLYFDNRGFELYNNKLLKNLKETPTLRIRWTSKLTPGKDVTVEKRTFLNETGVDDDIKLKLKEKYINDFIKLQSDEDDEESLDHSTDYASSKEFNVNKFTSKLTKRNLPQLTIQDERQKFISLQKFIREQRLEPVLRTVFTRTVFQVPGDEDKIRVVIDSDMLYIREDSFDKDRPIRDPKSWHRRDLDQPNLVNPFDVLREGEYAKFPYSIMEIRVNERIYSNPNSKTYKWVRDLVNSHLVKEVPNFSKFIQGISSLFLEDDNLDILPFWLPDLDQDIRRPPKGADYTDNTAPIVPTESNLKQLHEKILSPSINPTSGVNNPKLNNIIEERDDVFDLEEQSDDDNESSSSSARRLSLATARIHNRSANRNVSSKLDYESEDEEVILPAGVNKPTEYLKNLGPVRVEAKVWLANERTFLRWLHVTTMLTTLTFLIYSTVKSSHMPTVATVLAYLYFAMSIFSALWGYYIYMTRLELIKKRSGNHFDAVPGPIVLGVVLLVALWFNFFAGVRKAFEVATFGELNPDSWNDYLIAKVFNMMDK